MPADRDQRIVELRDSGVPAKEIAARFDLSAGRIREIIAARRLEAYYADASAKAAIQHHKLRLDLSFEDFIKHLSSAEAMND